MQRPVQRRWVRALPSVVYIGQSPRAAWPLLAAAVRPSESPAIRSAAAMATWRAPICLACDSLQSVDLIDPEGQQVRADADQNMDLYWACRGGGGGSFGIATSFAVRLKKVANVIVFRLVWPGLSIKGAKSV